jgi:hypothetical protein
MTTEQPPIVERSLEDEVRAIAEDSNYSNELLGIAVRNWFHRTTLLAKVKPSKEEGL